MNAAFLDRLEARGSGSASELPPGIPELGDVWQTEEPQDPASSPVSFPSQLHTDSTAEEGKLRFMCQTLCVFSLRRFKAYFVILSIATSPRIKTQFVSCD